MGRKRKRKRKERARAAAPKPAEGRAPRLSERVAETLLAAAARVAADREACARDPARDFLRERKLGLLRLLLLLVTWGQDTVAGELAEMCGWDGGAPSPSALTQQWKKLSDGAMPRLLREFLSAFGAVPRMGRYWLLAADGTEQQLLPGTGGPRCRVRNGTGDGFHWEMHATCAFDVARRVFVDAVFQGGAEEDEPGALCELAGRLRAPRGLVPLWLADRGFCNWNVIAHLKGSGASFCLRAKDPWMESLVGDDMPGGEFDMDLVRFVTRTRRLGGRSRPGEPWLYRVLYADRRFDALPPREPGEWRCELRADRLALPAADGDGADGDLWLNLVTDLPASELDARALAALYAERWSEETGFSLLKNVCGMRDPRTRDWSRAVQEVWGRLVLCDACSLGVEGVPEPGRGPVHARATDRCDAFKAFMAMLRHMVRRRAFDVEAYAARRSHSVRPGRSHPRRKRPKSPPKSCCRH